MPSTQRLSLLIESKTRGSAEVDKLTNALNKVVSVSERAGKKTAKASQDATTSLSRMSATIRNAVTNPMMAATGAIDRFTSSLGSVGLVVGGATVAVGALTAGAFRLMKGLGETSDAILDFSARTGLTVNQVDKLMAMSKLAAINIHVLERSAGRLAEALRSTDSTGKRAREALAELGVATRTATGGQREMGPIIMDVLEKMSRLRSQTEQAAKANTILGISGKELMPLIRSYREMSERVERLGFGRQAQLLNQFDKTRQSMEELGLQWELLKRKLAVPAKAVVDIVLGAIEGVQSRRFHLRSRAAEGYQFWYPPGPSAPPPPTAEWADIFASPVYERMAAEAAQRNRYLEAVRAGTFALPENLRNLPLYSGAMRGAYRLMRPSVGVGAISGALAVPGARTETVSPEISAGMLADLEQRRVSRVRQRLSYEEQIASLTVRNAGTIERLAAIRRAAALDEYSITRDRAALEDRLYEIEKQREVDLFELRTRHEEQLAAQREQAMYRYRDSVVAMFDALVASGRGGFSNFLRAQALGIGRQMLGNFATMTYSSVAGKLAIPGQGTAERPTFLGRLLAGTPFGLDPMARATDANTQATMENTLALRALTVGVGSGVGGLPGQVFQGAAGPLGMIFSAFGRKGKGASTVDLGGYFNLFGLGGKAASGAGALSKLTGALGAAAPYIGIGMMAGGLIASLLPNPKQRRAEEIDMEVQRARINLAGPTEFRMTAAGAGFDYNFAGAIRPVLVVNAMDAKSIVDHADEIADGLRAAMQRGHPVNETAREVVLAM